MIKGFGDQHNIKNIVYQTDHMYNQNIGNKMSFPVGSQSWMLCTYSEVLFLVGHLVVQRVTKKLCTFWEKHETSTIVRWYHEVYFQMWREVRFDLWVPFLAPGPMGSQRVLSTDIWVSFLLKKSYKINRDEFLRFLDFIRLPMT